MPSIICDRGMHHYDTQEHPSGCPFCRDTRPVTRPAVAATPATKPATGPVPTQVIWEDSAVGPVVGWLVVIDAPTSESGGDDLSNRGRDYRLVANRNTIGRGSKCQVCLDYGDLEISNEHCAIVYDHLNNMFHITASEGTNLTYIAEKGEDENVRWVPVLNARELKARESIRIGKTILVFVPFCGDGVFKWDFSAEKPE